MVASVAVRATWANGPPQVITIPGVNGFQSANLRVGSAEASGVDLGGGYAAAALVGVVLVVALGVLARGASRRALTITAVAFAVLAVVALYTGAGGVRARAERRGFRSPRVHRGVVVVTYAGAWAALCGAVVLAEATRRAGEARLPEGAPEIVEREPVESETANE